MNTCHAFCFSILCAALLTASPRSEAQEGSFDPSWSGNGRRLVDFNSERDVLNYMHVTPDNKVLLGGWCAPEGATSVWPCAARLHSGGALDLTFGPSGTGLMQFEEFGGVQSYFTGTFARSSDGALWFAGSTTLPGGITVTRLAEDGASILGAFTFHFNDLPAQPNSQVRAMVAASGNTIIIAGEALRATGGPRDIAVARLVLDASSGVIALDPTFGANGVVRTPFGKLVTDLLVLPDGRILLSGLKSGTPSSGMAPGFVMRLLVNGVIDDTFGTAAGNTPLRMCAGAYTGTEPRIAIDTQGRIATAYTAKYRGPDLLEQDSEICVNRLLPDGQQDEGFGGIQNLPGDSGPVRVNIGGSQSVESIAVGADSKIIVGGDVIGGRCPVRCFMVARLNQYPRNNTVLDLSYGGAGAGVGLYDGKTDWSAASSIVIGNGGLMIAGSAAHVLQDPFVPDRFGVAKGQLGPAAFDPVFADGFE